MEKQGKQDLDAEEHLKHLRWIFLSGAKGNIKNNITNCHSGRAEENAALKYTGLWLPQRDWKGKSPAFLHPSELIVQQVFWS